MKMIGVAVMDLKQHATGKPVLYKLEPFSRWAEKLYAYEKDVRIDPVPLGWKEHFADRPTTPSGHAPRVPNSHQRQVTGDRWAGRVMRCETRWGPLTTQRFRGRLRTSIREKIEKKRLRTQKLVTTNLKRIRRQ